MTIHPWSIAQQIWQSLGPPSLGRTSQLLALPTRPPSAAPHHYCDSPLIRRALKSKELTLLVGQ